jgi:hypothetical protein
MAARGARAASGEDTRDQRWIAGWSDLMTFDIVPVVWGGGERGFVSE